MHCQAEAKQGNLHPEVKYKMAILNHDNLQ